MKLAAHQPLFLPPLNFFFKMNQANIFLLADHLQYSTNADLNRGKIKTINGPEWLTVPVLSKGKSQQQINAVEIDNHENWQKRQLRTIFINYQNAPYFELYRDQLEEIYLRPWKKLCDLTVALITFFQSQLFIKAKIIRMSELNLSGATNEQIISAMRQSKCKQYVAEEQFQPFINESHFNAAGFKVNFIKYIQPKYYQQFNEFESGLSILDLLFNEGEMSYRYFHS